MTRICSHICNICNHYRAIAYLKSVLTEDGILLHLDFSENYNSYCTFDKEIQSVHLGASQRQISIHTGVAYTNTRNRALFRLQHSLISCNMIQV